MENETTKPLTASTLTALLSAVYAARTALTAAEVYVYFEGLPPVLAIDAEIEALAARVREADAAWTAAYHVSMWDTATDAQRERTEVLYTELRTIEMRLLALRGDRMTLIERLRAEWNAARYAAEDRLTEAREALWAAIEAAPWGRQDGSRGRVFIRRGSGWPNGKPWTIVCMDRLELVEIHGDGMSVHPVADAKRVREAQRTRARQAHEAYEVALEHATRVLVERSAEMLGWRIADGQQGGYIDGPMGRVGIPGLMRRSGMVATAEMDAVDVLLACQADARAIAEAQTGKSGRAPRARAIEAAEQSFRASDRARLLAEVAS